MVIIITAKVIYIISSDNDGRSERCLCVFVMGMWCRKDLHLL